MKKILLTLAMSAAFLSSAAQANPLTPGDFGRFDAASSASASGYLLELQNGQLQRVTPTQLVTATGGVVGPSSSTDNAVARFDSTTGKLLQNSVVLIGDTGAVTGVTTLAASTSVTTEALQINSTNGTSISAIRFAFDAVANGQTSKTTTLTGATSSSRCVASAAETATNSVYIRSVVPGTNQVVITTSGDPGASNMDYTVVCYN